MKLTDLLCCGLFAREKKGFTNEEKNHLVISQLRDPMIDKVLDEMKNNPVKTAEFFLNKNEKLYRSISHEQLAYRGQAYAEILATRANRIVALELIMRYQEGEEDAQEIIASLGDYVSLIQHDGFQSMLKGKQIATEVNEKTQLLI